MGSKSFQHKGVLGLFTETSLHCGAESGTGYVDQPIQRERHSNYPVIPGSSIKGVLKDEMNGKPGVKGIFGSEDAMSPGTVSFGDGVLAAFPVRSSVAPFHWVTCPLVLERVGRMLGAPFSGGGPAAGESWTKAAGADVLLEEIVVKRAGPPAALFVKGGTVFSLLDLLPPATSGFAYTRTIFLDRLLVVNDETFRELVETGTEVVTRIKLNAIGTTTDIKKTEKERYEKELDRKLSENDLKGNMFVQELVPPETLFAAAIRAGGDVVLPWPSVVRLGGNETIGHGVTHVSWVPAAGVKKG